MQTLNAPIYEVKQDSSWYKAEMKRKEDIKIFFEKIKSEYGLGEGFGFYHSEYFGIHAETKDFEAYKDELLKNPNNKDFHPFKKRSKYFQPIKELIEQIEEASPFKSHDVLGTNNISASQWIGDRWFFGVKHEKYVKGDEASPIDYKEYLKIVMDNLD
ncbi:hypothetical protein [Metabacillus fastidiosus]|uniref:hypothetical protein n=1 Tax=Metabacillus fastidiosus TaxID=1458 RepID=UPI003D297843